MKAHQCMTTSALSGLLVTTAAQAGGTQRILSRDKACEMTVPANWKIDKLIKSEADTPNKSMYAVIESPRPKITLAQIKPFMEKTQVPVKVFEDSPQRLWYQFKADADDAYGIHWYIGAPRQGGVCAGSISFKKASQTGPAKQVALSVKPAS